jgi:large subunit ribosomal protein L21
VAGVQVVGQILRQGKAKKILVFKKKRRKNYRRLRGHRQPFTALQVKEIQL